eukprot:m51a1_g9810 hypothetical protein (431) ;mRNA; r:1835438-1837700
MEGSTIKDKEGSETTSAISVRLGTASALSQQSIRLGTGSGGAAGPFRRGSHDGFRVCCSDLCGPEIATVVVSSDCSGAVPAWALEELTVRGSEAGAPTLVFACGRVLDGLNPSITLSSPSREDSRTAAASAEQCRCARPYSIEVTSSRRRQRLLLACDRREKREGEAERQERRNESEAAASIAGLMAELRLSLRSQQAVQERLANTEAALASLRSLLPSPQSSSEADDPSRSGHSEAYDYAGGPGQATYTVTTQTGDLWDAGTTEEVYVVLRGARGARTEKLRLTRVLGADEEGSGDLPEFHRGARDVFSVTAADVGDVRAVDICLGEGSDCWFLEWVEVARQPSLMLPKRFPCHCWLDRNEADGRTAVTLPGRTSDGGGPVAAAGSSAFTSSVWATLCVVTGDVAHHVGPVQLGSGNCFSKTCSILIPS